MELLQEYSELKKTIDYHMDRYYNQDEPEISDYEYDKLMIRLKEIGYDSIFTSGATRVEIVLSIADLVEKKLARKDQK